MKLFTHDLHQIKLPNPATFTLVDLNKGIQETTLSYESAEIIQEYISQRLRQVLRQLKQVYIPKDPKTEGLCLSIESLEYIINKEALQ
jgi:hypothetical protein